MDPCSEPQCRGASAFVFKISSCPARADAAEASSAPSSCLSLLLVRDHTACYSAPMETRDKNRAAGGSYERRTECAKRALAEELHIKVAAEALRDASLFQLIPVPFASRSKPTGGEQFNNACFVARDILPTAQAHDREAFHALRVKFERLGYRHCWLETTDMAEVAVKSLLELPLFSEELDLDMDEVRCKDVLGRPLPLRSVFCKVLKHAGMREALQRMQQMWEEGKLKLPAAAAASSSTAASATTAAGSGGAEAGTASSGVSSAAASAASATSSAAGPGAGAEGAAGRGAGKEDSSGSGKASSDSEEQLLGGLEALAVSPYLLARLEAQEKKAHTAAVMACHKKATAAAADAAAAASRAAAGLAITAAAVAATAASSEPVQGGAGTLSTSVA